MYKKLGFKMLVSLVTLLVLPAVIATVTLELTNFDCSPDEVIVSGTFSCTATVQNSGDETGTLNTATLYPDSDNWMEESSYAETVNVNIDSGASSDVTFDNLKGSQSGDNGFDRITLDDVTDTYVADNSITVNVIDVVVTDSATVSSAAENAEFDVTAQATAGGNVDIELSFSGCSIGNQAASATTSSLTDGQTASRTWTVTQGSSDCSYTVTATATSNPSGTASTTDTATGTVDCSDCSSGGGSSSSSSGGGSSGGGSSGGGGGSSSSGAGGTGGATAASETDEGSDGLTPEEKIAQEQAVIEQAAAEAAKAREEALAEADALAGKGFMNKVINYMSNINPVWPLLIVIITAIAFGGFLYRRWRG
jgi:hypothetical protein